MWKPKEITKRREVRGTLNDKCFTDFFVEEPFHKCLESSN